jgi:hypothetical protein
VLVASESELCTRSNNTSHIYLSLGLLQRERESERVSFNYLYTPTLSGKSVCGDLLTCTPLFIASVFEVPLKKKRKKRKKRRKKGSLLKKKKKKEARG